MRKRTSLRYFAIFVLSMGLLLTSFISTGQIVAEAEAVPSHITLTWTGDTQTTQTITWKTDVNTPEGQVQYHPLTPGIDGEFQTAAAQVERVDSNWGEFNIHTATLSGLKPGTRYVYRVGSPEAWSESYQFTTAPAKPAPYKFLVFGDSQSFNYDIWRTTLQQAHRNHPSAAFFINVGDLVDNGQEYGQWYDWFNAGHGVMETLPCMPVVGNHETYKPGGGTSLPILFTEQFKLPMNGPDGLKGQVYSLDYGDAHLAMLDTQIGEEGRFVPDMLEKEKAWLEADLAASKQKWKLVFVHKALYNNKAQDNSTIQAGFAPIIDKYHVDVVFTAHDHVYARTWPLYGGMRVSNFSEGTVYVATGRSGSKTYADSIPKGWNSFFYNPLTEPNYLVVEIQNDGLTVRAFSQNGQAIDSWNIIKKD